jgi:hypothetical protein
MLLSVILMLHQHLVNMNNIALKTRSRLQFRLSILLGFHTLALHCNAHLLKERVLFPSLVGLFPPDSESFSQPSFILRVKELTYFLRSVSQLGNGSVQ